MRTRHDGVDIGGYRGAQGAWRSQHVTGREQLPQFEARGDLRNQGCTYMDVCVFK
jgi:hypothetical protein